MKSNARRFDIQFHAEGADEGAIELEEELTKEQHEALDSAVRRAYIEKNGKFFLNRKGKDAQAEALRKERDERRKAEAALKDLGLPVEDVKKILAEYQDEKKKNQTEAEKLQEAIAGARKESEATKAEMLALRAELEASKLEQTRLQVQSELKVPAALMKFLTGTDYEGLAASARELMAHVKPEDPSKVTIGSGTPPGGTLPPNAGEIEAKVKAGLEKAKKINESFAGSKDERRAY